MERTDVAGTNHGEAFLSACDIRWKTAVFHGKRPFSVFEPPLGGLGSTYTMFILGSLESA